MVLIYKLCLSDIWGHSEENPKFYIQEEKNRSSRYCGRFSPKTVQEQWRALQRGFDLNLQECDKCISKIKFIQAIEFGTMSATR